MSPTQDGPITSIFIQSSYASRFNQAIYSVTPSATVSEICLGECLITAFQFIRERNVFDLAFLVISQRRIRHGLERFCTTGAEVKDAGNAIFQEPQVHISHVAHVDEVAFKVLATFEQLR